MRRVLDAPETNVAIFALLLDVVWEFAQAPLFAGMRSVGHLTGILLCFRAAIGDAVITLAGFWVVAAVSGSRAWILRPTARRVAGFVTVGVLVTIVMEWLATRVLGRWAYAETVAVVPLLGVGVAPLVQWIVLPPLVVWFVRRQLT